MTIMASTWGKTREICARNQAILKSAIEGWGVCGTTTTFGDPRRAWVNTILAASGGSGPVPLYPRCHMPSRFSRLTGQALSGEAKESDVTYRRRFRI